MIKFCILKLIETSKTNLELLNDEMHLEFKCIKNENNQLSCSIIMTKKASETRNPIIGFLKKEEVLCSNIKSVFYDLLQTNCLEQVKNKSKQINFI